MSPQSNIASFDDNFQNNENYDTCRELLIEIIETSLIIVDSYCTYNRYVGFKWVERTSDNQLLHVSSATSGMRKNERRATLNEYCYFFDSIFHRCPYNVPKENINELMKAAGRVAKLNEFGSSITDGTDFKQCFTSDMRNQSSENKSNDRWANPLTDFFKIIYNIIESASRNSNICYKKKFPLEVKTDCKMHSYDQQESVVHETNKNNSSNNATGSSIKKDALTEIPEPERKTGDQLYPNMKSFHEDLLKVITYLIEITIALLETYKELGYVDGDKHLKVKKRKLHNLCHDFVQIIKALVSISQSKCLHKSVTQSNLSVSESDKSNISRTKVINESNKRKISADKKIDRACSPSADKPLDFPFGELIYLETLRDLLETSSNHVMDSGKSVSFSTRPNYLSSDAQCKNGVENADCVESESNNFCTKDANENVVTPILRIHNDPKSDLKIFTSINDITDVTGSVQIIQERNVKFDEDLNIVHTVSLGSENQFFPITRDRKDAVKNSKNKKGKKLNKKNNPNINNTNDDEHFEGN